MSSSLSPAAIVGWSRTATPLRAQPPDEHVERIVNEGQGVFLPGRLVVGPEDEHARVQRPVELQGGRRKLAECVLRRECRDGLQVTYPQRGGIVRSGDGERTERGLQKRGQMLAQRLELSQTQSDDGKQVFFERFTTGIHLGQRIGSRLA